MPVCNQPLGSSLQTCLRLASLSVTPAILPCQPIMPRAQDRSLRSPWPNSRNSPAYQFNRGQPWLSPKPDTCLFNVFGESFELQALKEKIAKGQMPHCLYKDPAAVDQQPLNRQEMWAAMQYKPIYRTAGRWTYWDLLPDDIRQPPPQFCNEIEDAPKQPPASRTQPKEKARPKHVPPSARPSLAASEGLLGRCHKAGGGLRAHHLAGRSLGRLQQAQSDTNQSLRLSNICARRSPNPTCPRKAIPSPRRCPPSLLKPPSHLRISQLLLTGLDPPMMRYRTCPQPTQRRSTRLGPDRTWTLRPSALWTSLEPPPSPISFTTTVQPP